MHSQQDSLLSSTSRSSAKGMKWIPAGTFLMGATDNEGRTDEYPSHLVKLDGFWMDEKKLLMLNLPNLSRLQVIKQ
ncbi:SUMF1/EgtB/PvdO family nonheme iron enzyme [Pedobacter steynii]